MGVKHVLIEGVCGFIKSFNGVPQLFCSYSQTSLWGCSSTVVMTDEVKLPHLLMMDLQGVEYLSNFLDSTKHW